MSKDKPYDDDDFLNRYVEQFKIKKPYTMQKDIDSCRREINRLIKKENLYIDKDGELVLLEKEFKQKVNEEEQAFSTKRKVLKKICNFYVVPTHKLYYDNGVSIKGAGLAVEIIAKMSKRNYKKIYLNLTNNMIERGDWITSVILDHEGV